MRELRCTVVFKAHPPPRQAEFAGQQVKLLQARLFARPKVKVKDIRQISPAEARVELKPRRFVLGDAADRFQAAAVGQCRWQNRIPKDRQIRCRARRSCPDPAKRR